jgi:hypothetical protein
VATAGLGEVGLELALTLTPVAAVGFGRGHGLPPWLEATRAVPLTHQRAADRRIRPGLPACYSALSLPRPGARSVLLQHSLANLRQKLVNTSLRVVLQDTDEQKPDSAQETHSTHQRQSKLASKTARSPSSSC